MMGGFGFPFLDAEGLNGHFAGPDDDDCGDDPGYTYGVDPNYHHVMMFHPSDKPSVEHETEKAVLFRVTDGLFWCPKSLLRRYDKNKLDVALVWKGFHRKILEQAVP